MWSGLADLGDADRGCRDHDRHAFDDLLLLHEAAEGSAGEDIETLPMLLDGDDVEDEEDSAANATFLSSLLACADLLDETISGHTTTTEAIKDAGFPRERNDSPRHSPPGISDVHDRRSPDEHSRLVFGAGLPVSPPEVVTTASSEDEKPTETAASSRKSTDEQRRSPAKKNPAASSSSSSRPPSLSVIAYHRRKGRKSLSELQERVRTFAKYHTFKETARMFGLHHSTVSGWVKESVRPTDGGGAKAQSSIVLPGDVTKEAEVKLLAWLKASRFAGRQLLAEDIRTKLREILGKEPIDAGCSTSENWMLHWSNRRERDSASSERRRRSASNLSYPLGFKLEVALYAQSHSQYAASKAFGVSRRRIFDWLRQIPRFTDLVSVGQTRRPTGRGPRSRDVDAAVHEWYCLRRAKGERPRSAHVQAKARELYSALGHADMKCSYGWLKRWSRRFGVQLRHSCDDQLVEWALARFDANEAVSLQELQARALSVVAKEDAEFKASTGWAMRFCGRHRAVLDPHHAAAGARMPDVLEERADVFRTALARVVAEKGFGAANIGCMDELVLHLRPAAGKRDCGLGPPTGLAVLRSSGMRDADAVVILAATADGTMLTPMLVARQDCSQGSWSSLNLDISVHLVEGSDSAPLVDDSVVSHWLRSVWLHEVASPCLLLADAFGPHSSAAAQKAMTSAPGSCLALLPAGCSHRLQPLHRGITRAFKIFVEKKYFRSTTGGRGNGSDVVQLPLLAKLINEAYHKLKAEKGKIESAFHSREYPGVL